MGKKKSIAGTLRRLMPDCKDMTMLIVKQQEIALSFSEKFRMYFHIYLVCKFCRLFYKQSRALDKHVHTLMHRQTMDHHLSPEEKVQMQARIEKESGKS